jgi:16S rRNA (cytosine1402-N4)-methyltransferase
MLNRLSHQSVLLKEAMVALSVRTAGVYIDASFGRGGHSAAILAALGPAGRLLALDRDPEAEHCARERFGSDPRFRFERINFGLLIEAVKKYGLTRRVDGILMDIGASSPQLDNPARGFSFVKQGPLDMRMDPTTGVSASRWLSGAGEVEISTVLKQFGEERFHRRIAKAIVKARQEAPIVTTARLAQIIASAVPTREKGKHPATRSFQAIRIFINGELAELESALAQALEVLAVYGRLVVISFHSLEDRIVKRFMRRQARGPELPPELPVQARDDGATLRLIGRPIRPSANEIESNPRARSAVMRVAERLA